MSVTAKVHDFCLLHKTFGLKSIKGWDVLGFVACLEPRVHVQNDELRFTSELVEGKNKNAPSSIAHLQEVFDLVHTEVSCFELLCNGCKRELQ